MGTNFSQLNVVVNKDNSFMVDLLDMTTPYKLPKITYETKELIERWKEDQMSFYQNQLNFAIYCATAACGVDFGKIVVTDPYISALYNFHIYYTVRRIFNSCDFCLPTENIFDLVNNYYDHGRFLNVCNDFGVDPNHNFRQTVDPHTNGLGTAYYFDRAGTGRWLPVPSGNFDLDALYPMGKKYDQYKVAEEIAKTVGTTLEDALGYKVSLEPEDHKVMSWHYAPVNSGKTVQYVVGYIEQDPKVATTGWWGFIPHKRAQLTDVGIRKVNESIRAYVYALLGAQAQTKTSVLAATTGFDAQQRFKQNIQALFNEAPDLGQSINQFQDSLQNAKPL